MTNILLLILFSTSLFAVEWITPQTFDFGKSGAKLEHTFYFKNHAAKPVIISIENSMKEKSKECYVKSFTKQPVLQTGIGHIKVACKFTSYEFRSRTLRAILFTGDKPIMAKLVIKGRVIKPGLSNSCDKENRCEGVYKKKKICFYKESEKEDIISHGVKADCWGLQSIEVSSNSLSFTKALDKEKKQCNQISEMKFTGHGTERGMSDLYDDKNIRYRFERYSCLMSEGAKVKLYGCNTGASCGGRISMYLMGETLLSERGGTVIGNVTKSISAPLFGDIAPSGSRVKYVIGKDGKRSWVLTGTVLAGDQSLARVCQSECRRAIERINKLKKPNCIFSSIQSVLKACSETDSGESDKSFFDSLRAEAIKSKYHFKFNETDLSKTLDGLDKKIDNCKEKEKKVKKTKTEKK